jgi:hypothetical protein
MRTLPASGPFVWPGGPNPESGLFMAGPPDEPETAPEDEGSGEPDEPATDPGADGPIGFDEDPSGVNPPGFGGISPG